MTDAPDPDWLVWARRIQAIAQTGLAFDPNQYDRDRYETLRSIAIDMMASRGGADPVRLASMFANETGYATPKTDVRGAAFREGKILLVREAADHGRWALPGGWADVGLTPSENVVKELFEETGFVVRARKLAAVWDRTRQGHTPQPFHAYKCFFICDIMSGIARPSAETTEVAFFAEDAIPDDLSLDRVQPRQIARMFAHAAQPDLPTDFE